MKLHQLKRHPQASKKHKRVGRGFGSGHGRFSTRGGKGQTARTGHSKMPARFEGGRQPIIRQMPKKRGFRSLNVSPVTLALSELNVFNDGDNVNLASLKQKGIVKKTALSVKILKGEIKKKLNVKLPISDSAKKAVEAAGGKVIRPKS